MDNLKVLWTYRIDMFGTPFGTEQRQYSSASTYVKDNLVLEKKTILIYHILICLCPHSVLQHFL